MVTLTPQAVVQIKQILEDNKEKVGLRVYVQGGGCSGFQYGLMLDNPQDGEEVIEIDGVKLFIDPISITYVKGMEIDFVESSTGGGFRFNNPKATSTCGCGQSFSTDK